MLANLAERVLEDFNMFPIIYSERFLERDNGRFHPERRERLTAIIEAINATNWADRIQWNAPTPVDRREVLPWIQQAHAQDYINLVRQIAEEGGGMLDMDTLVCPQSYEIALLAVSAWLDGVDRALNDNSPVFVLARPPGHHAERKMGMGFCLFSNAAIAAEYALTQPNIDRVAILDWDVHHGNGTQHITESNPRIAYCSLHQSPGYPYTGRSEERGMHENVLNIPLSPRSTVTEYQTAFEGQVIPFLQNFQPDLLVVSAGYDANRDDPLSGMDLQPQDYGVFTHLILPLTHRIVFGLEGGYDLPSLGKSVVATIESCLTASYSKRQEAGGRGKKGKP
nr:histone deacetylase [Lusitaniella coriacea]